MATEAADFEVYPNAPLQLVALELRFPFSPRLGTNEPLAFFHERLRDAFPFVEPLGQQQMVMMVGQPEGASAIKTAPLPTQSLFRLSSLDRTTAITVSGSNLIVETGHYVRYGLFRRMIEQLLTVLGEFGGPVGVQRIGLRYIDEIRVPSVIDSPGDWSAYISDELIAASHIGERASPELQPESWRGLIEFARAPDSHVVMRYGASVGYAVNPEGPLRIHRVSEPGPYFLLDLDSFWGNDEDLLEFSPDGLMEKCDQLHRPVRAIFESVITEQLRDEVLRREPA